VFLFESPGLFEECLRGLEICFQFLKLIGHRKKRTTVPAHRRSEATPCYPVDVKTRNELWCEFVADMGSVAQTSKENECGA